MNKIDEKKDRFDAVQAPRQELISRFREDPLFVIKKLEQDQQKLLDKYNAIKSKSTESHRHIRYPKSDRRSRDSCRESQSSHSIYDSKHKGSRDKYVQGSDGINKKYPKIPNKVNPLDYAFGVNEDIAPPDTIQATARERAANAIKSGGYYSKSYLNKHRKHSPSPTNYRSEYEKLKEYGKEHLEKSAKRTKYSEEYGRMRERAEERDISTNFNGNLKNKMYSSYIDKVERDRRT